MQDNPPRAGGQPSLMECHNSNGHSDGHFSPDGDAIAETKAGKVIFVTVPKGLDAEMKRMRFDAVDYLASTLKNEVDGRRAIVAYQGRQSVVFASQAAQHIQEKCHAEREGTLDLGEMGFYGEPDSFVDWWDEALGSDRFDGYPDFMQKVQERTSWMPRTVPVDSIEDDDEEFGNPVPDVDEAAFYGPLGRLVIGTQSETEANALFVLLHLMTFAGAAMGRHAYFVMSADLHHPNLGVAIIAQSGMRKGSSGNVAKAIFRRIDKEFCNNNIMSGLNTGRGFLVNIRDARLRRGKNGKEIEDPGVRDKRRVFLEPELASVLLKGHADTNELLCFVRQALDGDERMQSLTSDGDSSTNSHVSIIGHLTPSDMTVHIRDNDKGNGTAGRFMFHFGARSKRLPRGGDIQALLDTGALDDQMNQVRNAIEFARSAGKMKWAPGVLGRWEKIYCDLDDKRPPGLIGNLFTRGPTFIIRPAMIFALTDGKREIDHPHLDAALAIWKHQAQTLRYLFPADIDHNAEKLMAALRKAPEGLTRSQITHSVFGGHTGKETLDSLLKDMQANRAITAKRAPSDGPGRRAIIYSAAVWAHSGATKST